VREFYLGKNPELVEEVIKALIEGEAFALSPSHKSATLN
jgi:ABC-type nitrate/sulfonate/bicarbonate transport system substrate-binding protein